MEFVVLAVVIGILLFGFVLLFGAPYLPTLKSQLETGLELLDLKPGQHILELGCGDGRVLIAAAEQGLRVTGYELNPVLAVIAWVRTRRYRGRVKVVWGNFWQVKLPQAEAIFTFLLPKYMSKLDKKIVHDMKTWSSDAAEKLSQKKINPVVDFHAASQSKANHPGHLAEMNMKAHYRVKLVSIAFKIDNKKTKRTQNGVFLYEY